MEVSFFLLNFENYENAFSDETIFILLSDCRSRATKNREVLVEVMWRGR